MQLACTGCSLARACPLISLCVAADSSDISPQTQIDSLLAGSGGNRPASATPSGGVQYDSDTLFTQEALDSASECARGESRGAGGNSSVAGKRAKRAKHAKPAKPAATAAPQRKRGLGRLKRAPKKGSRTRAAAAPPESSGGSKYDGSAFVRKLQTKCSEYASLVKKKDAALARLQQSLDRSQEASAERVRKLEDRIRSMSQDALVVESVKTVARVQSGTDPNAPTPPRTPTRRGRSDEADGTGVDPDADTVERPAKRGRARKGKSDADAKYAALAVRYREARAEAERAREAGALESRRLREQLAKMTSEAKSLRQSSRVSESKALANDGKVKNLAATQNKLRGLVQELLKTDRKRRRRASKEEAFWSRVATEELLDASEVPAAFPTDPLKQRQIAWNSEEFSKVEAQLARARREAQDLQNRLQSERDKNTKLHSQRTGEIKALRRRVAKQHNRLVGAVRRVKYLVELRKGWEATRREKDQYIAQLEAKLLELSGLGARGRHAAQRKALKPPPPPGGAAVQTIPQNKIKVIVAPEPRKKKRYPMQDVNPLRIRPAPAKSAPLNRGSYVERAGQAANARATEGRDGSEPARSGASSATTVRAARPGARTRSRKVAATANRRGGADPSEEQVLAELLRLEAIRQAESTSGWSPMKPAQDTKRAPRSESVHTSIQDEDDDESVDNLSLCSEPASLRASTPLSANPHPSRRRRRGADRLSQSMTLDRASREVSATHQAFNSSLRQARARVDQILAAAGVRDENGIAGDGNVESSSAATTPRRARA